MTIYIEINKYRQIVRPIKITQIKDLNILSEMGVLKEDDIDAKHPMPKMQYNIRSNYRRQTNE